MQNVTLQIPMKQNLKTEAEKAAKAQGFSSLQELVRVMLSRFAQNKIEVTFEEVVKLSLEAEKRYLKATKDFKSGKNVYTASSIKDLISQLNEN